MSVASTQPRKPVHKTEAISPVAMSSTGQTELRFALATTDAIAELWTAFDAAIVPVSDNGVLTT